jgi:hypothetical protein
VRRQERLVIVSNHYRVTHTIELRVTREPWAINAEVAASPATILAMLPAAYRQDARVIDTVVEVIPRVELDAAARARVIQRLACELSDEQLVSLANDIRTAAKKGNLR